MRGPLSVHQCALCVEFYCLICKLCFDGHGDIHWSVTGDLCRWFFTDPSEDFAFTAQLALPLLRIGIRVWGESPPLSVGGVWGGNTAPTQNSLSFCVETEYFGAFFIYSGDLFSLCWHIKQWISGEDDWLRQTNRQTHKQWVTLLFG